MTSPLAALAHVPRRAEALVPPHAVHAFALVEALGLVRDRVGEGGAVVHVDLAVNACAGGEGNSQGLGRTESHFDPRR